MEPVIIIAEAGVNHNGSLEMAKQLIDVAIDAGVDYVKFQTFKAENLVTRTAKKADYQIKNTKDESDSQFEMLKKLELSEDMHEELFSYCVAKGIGFISSGFDEQSIDYLDRLGVDLFKIPSGEIINKPYLRHIAGKGKPVILSTGMSDLSEIEAALEVLKEGGIIKEKISVLHCNTEYPTPMMDVNLSAMDTIREKLNVQVGYSDHTQGIEIPIAAVAMGAAIIEKHFTLDHNLQGPDHKASLDPSELKAMVKAIRNVELALSGDGLKKASMSETLNKNIVRKSLHYKRNMNKDTVIKFSDLIALRPGDGISPMIIDDIVGKKLLTNVSAFQQVRLNDLA